MADPAADIFVRVTDQDGDDIPVAVKKLPAMKSRKGFSSRISFGIEFISTVDHVEIECKAENDVGEAVSTIKTVVTCEYDWELCKLYELLNTITIFRPSNYNNSYNHYYNCNFNFNQNIINSNFN